MEVSTIVFNKNCFEGSLALKVELGKPTLTLF